jgi:hypothetical protein
MRLYWLNLQHCAHFVANARGCISAHTIVELLVSPELEQMLSYGICIADVYEEPVF